MVFDFVPTLVNYAVTLLGLSRSQMAIDQGFGMGITGDGGYDSRRAILDSIVVSIGSTTITMVVAVFAAYALSRMVFKGRADLSQLGAGPALHAAHRHPDSAGDDLQGRRACATPTTSTAATSA